MVKLTDQTDELTKLTAPSLEAALAEAIERELTARQAGAAKLQAEAMDQIRQLRLLLQRRDA